MRPKINSYENIYDYWMKNNDLICPHFCTCHDSRAVMTCAKLWADWFTKIRTNARITFTRFELWAHKMLVESVPALSVTCPKLDFFNQSLSLFPHEFCTGSKSLRDCHIWTFFNLKTMSVQIQISVFFIIFACCELPTEFETDWEIRNKNVLQ